MSENRIQLNRRDFLRASVSGGFTLGGMLGLGLNMAAAQQEVRRLKIDGTREVPRPGTVALCHIRAWFSRKTPPSARISLHCT